MKKITPMEAVLTVSVILLIALLGMLMYQVISFVIGG